MADLYFGDSDEERLIVMQGEIRRMHSDIYGNGKPGLLDEFRSFTASFEGAENEREKQHRSNTARLNLIIAILSVIAAYVAIILTVKGLNHALVEGPFHSTIPALHAER